MSDRGRSGGVIGALVGGLLIVAILAALVGYWMITQGAPPPRVAGRTAAGHAVDRLAVPLARAWAAASKQAASEGVSLQLTSGWRSRAHQQRLFDQAVTRYGSPQRAARWVLPPDSSAHVSGHAIDVGPLEAARWLEQHGVAYGLCRRYTNEWWHFELLTSAGGKCPALLADAAG